MRNYTKFTSSHAVDCTSFLSQTKKSSSNKYPIERGTVSLGKSDTRGKNGGFSTDTASRYTAGIDIYRWIDSVTDILDIFPLAIY